MVKWIKNTKAFTLTEVMVAVVIIAILMMIAIPNFMHHIESSNKTTEYVTPQERDDIMEKGGHQGVY